MSIAAREYQKMVESVLRDASNKIDALKQENVQLKEIIAIGRDVVLDFMPNIAHCVQDYAKLNEFLIKSKNS